MQEEKEMEEEKAREQYLSKTPFDPAVHASAGLKT